MSLQPPTRNALIYLRHQLRCPTTATINAVARRNSKHPHRPRQQYRTNVNTTASPIARHFEARAISKFANMGLGDMKMIQKPREGLLKELTARGFIGQFHGDTEDFTLLSDTQVLHLYAGADATADSLHLGHLMVLMPLIHSMLHGHKITILIGTATARIGDPSGRTTEREGMLSKELGEKTWHHGRAITTQVSTLLSSAITHATQHRDPIIKKSEIGRRAISDNLNWHRNLSVIDFFRIVGPRARMGEMTLRKHVADRMKSKEGMSYGEFSYQLIQALDYWHLFTNMGVRVQVGGSDQWGNITAGCDLINKMVNEAEWIDKMDKPELIREEAKPYGFTVPLLLTATGEKFSKSTGGAQGVWLSRDKTPPFALYQFLLQRTDEQVEDWLKWFTILPLETIEKVMAEQKDAPEMRRAQKLLAMETISLLHGLPTARDCEASTKRFFERDEENQSPFTVEDANMAIDKKFWTKVQYDAVFEQPLEEILVKGKVVESKTAARKLLASGGLRMGPMLEKVVQSKESPLLLKSEDIIDDRLVIFRVGKNTLHLVKITNSDDGGEEEQEAEEWRAASAKPSSKNPKTKSKAQRTHEKIIAKKKAAKMNKNTESDTDWVQI